MSASTAIIAALPREIASLVRGTRPDPTLLSSGIHLYRLPRAVLVAAGMGPSRAAIAVEAARAAANIETLISVGLAGSCTPVLRAGSVVFCGRVVDTRTGERYETIDFESGHVLATNDAIASVHEKERLAATYGAALVDMEAATVARLATAHNLRFRAIKAISDDFDFELDSLAAFEGKNGSFRTGAFALHTALRPWTWGAAMMLGRNSAAALKALNQELATAL